MDAPHHELHALRDGREQVEFLLQEASGAEWLYRRDDRIRKPIAELGATPQGIPALAPEIVLLFKAKEPRDPDIADLQAALLLLDPDRLSWLRWAIELAHPGSPFLGALPPS